MPHLQTLPEEIFEFLSKTGEKSAVHHIRRIPVADILPSPHQPRRSFDPAELHALAQSIATCGILQPLVVNPCGDHYYLVAGERRLRAAEMLGLKEVPCILYDRPAEECALATMVENLQRQNLSFWEEAHGYRIMLDKFSFTQEQLARRMGKTQSTIANKLRLLRLSPEVQRQLSAANCSERHARALLQLEDDAAQLAAARTIIQRKYNVTQAEHYIAGLCKPKMPRNKPTPLVRDRRICRNTLDHAVGLIRKAGIRAVAHTNETNDFIEYIVRIPKA